MRYRPSRRLIIATSIIVTAAVTFVLLLPEIARRVTLSRIENVITVPVTIADVDLNLFTGRARFEKLLIGDPAHPIARLPELTLRFSSIALLSGRIDVEQLILRNPALSFERIGPEPHSEKARATYCAADAWSIFGSLSAYSGHQFGKNGTDFHQSSGADGKGRQKYCRRYRGGKGGEGLVVRRLARRGTR